MQVSGAYLTSGFEYLFTKIDISNSIYFNYSQIVLFISWTTTEL